MQTSDLNVNKSDHTTAIFRQFQDAIFSREHISVKTSTKIIFDLLQHRPPKLSVWFDIASFKMAVNIKDLYGNSGRRFKSINTR